MTNLWFFTLVCFHLVGSAALAGPALPGGSWIETATRITVTPLTEEEGGKDLFLLRAKLETTTPQGFFQGNWKWAETVFSVGDQFANRNGRFVAETDRGDDDKTGTLQENPTGTAYLSGWEAMALIIPPFGLIWGEHVKKSLVETRRELKAIKAQMRSREKEILRLQHALKKLQTKGWLNQKLRSQEGEE